MVAHEWFYGLILHHSFEDYAQLPGVSHLPERRIPGKIPARVAIHSSHAGDLVSGCDLPNAIPFSKPDGTMQPLFASSWKQVICSWFVL